MKKQTEPILSDDPAAIKKRFDALFERVNKGSCPDRDALPLRTMMRAHPELKLWRRMPGPGATAISYLLQMNIAGAAITELWRERVDDLLIQFGYEAASIVEQMLIQHIILCWLQLTFVELHYAQVLKGGEVSLAQGAQLDRRVTLAQKRFTRATDALTRTRAMLAAARYANERADAAAEERAQRPGPRALRA
jgi:hypothetical protein